MTLEEMGLPSFSGMQKEIEELRTKLERATLERDFIKEYLNPRDLSFQNMMDAFMEMSPDQKEKMIDLSRSLAALAETRTTEKG